MWIKFIDDETEYRRLAFNDDKNDFILYDDEEKNNLECYSVMPLKKEPHPENYSLLILHNERNDYTENSIYQVRVYNGAKDERIGWIFPIQALLSKDHDFVDNEHFQVYAYIAYYLLLSKAETNNEKTINGQEYLTLTNLYDENITLLITNNEITKDISGFSIKDYYVDLYRKGYSLEGHGNLVTNVEKSDTSIHLKKISSQLCEFAIINKLFEKSIPISPGQEFARFYVYYQLVEILITAVFKNHFEMFISTINSNINNLFDNKDKLNSIINEKNRIKMLFGSYTSIECEKKEVLNNTCLDLLRRCGKKESHEVADNLYMVRCLLVHELYSVGEDCETIIKAVNDAFLEVIFDALFSFNAGQC